MTLFAAGSANTPLSPDEQACLIPSLATREELNEWERANILIACDWALSPRTLKRHNPLTQSYILGLHRRMFDQTWKRAGKYRNTVGKTGVPPHQIRYALEALLGDARYWLEYRTFISDELAVRFHHRLMLIHPFSNGNERHARLMADVLAKMQNRPIFTWGGADIVHGSSRGKSYIAALREADKGNFASLLEFARS